MCLIEDFPSGTDSEIDAAMADFLTEIMDGVLGGAKSGIFVYSHATRKNYGLGAVFGVFGSLVCVRVGYVH